MLDPIAKKALFWGFSTRVKCYRLWCRDSKNVVLSCDGTFNELEMPILKVQIPNSSNGTTYQVQFETFVDNENE